MQARCPVPGVWLVLLNEQTAMPIGKIILLILLAVVAVFLLIHTIPYLLGALAIIGVVKVWQSVNPPRGPRPPIRWF